MGPDADAARFGELHGVAHDIGIAGVEAAGDVDRRRQLDHRGVIAHFPGTKALAEIAVEIDCLHVGCSLLDELCHVPASTALTALPATLASRSASMLRSKFSMLRSRSGRVRSNSANLFA